MEPVLYKDKNILKKRTSFAEKLSLKKIGYLLFVFFSARAPFFEGALPFGMALFAAEYGKSIPYLTGASVLLSLSFMPSSISSALVSAFGMLLFCLLKLKIKTDTVLKTASASGICISISYLFIHIFSGINLYDISLMALQGVCVFSFVFLYRGFKNALKTYPLLSYEGRLSFLGGLSVMAVGMCTSGKLSFWGVFLFCAYLCLSLSYKNGIGTGCICAVLSGLICGLAGGDLSFYVAFFTVCTLTGGLFSGFGRICSALGFIFAALVVTFFSTSAMFALFCIIMTCVSICVFLLVPEKYLIHTDKAFEADSAYCRRMQKINLARMQECADAVRGISGIYEQMCMEAEKRDSTFYDRVTFSLCGECENQNVCWGRNIAKTYTAFFVMQEICTEKGKILYSDIPEYLSGNCIRRSEIVKAVSSGYELYKLDRLWSGICEEGRICTGKQLFCISEMLSENATESGKIKVFDREAENKIKRLLFMRKMYCEDVFVSERREEAEIFFGSDGEKDINLVEEVIGNALGRGYYFVRGDRNHMVFAKSPVYKMDFSVLQKEKDGNSVCGDSASVILLPKGKLAALLCDGMGSGKGAHHCSSSAVKMAEKMLSYGFDAKNALEIINSSLVLKSSETSFSTVDLFTINLSTLDASFYKMGAVSSFIKRGREIKEIKSDTLPLGTFSKSDIYNADVTLMEGDTIIMISDGVYGKKEEIRKIISEHTGEESEVLARKIFKLYAGEKVSDDITVITGTVFKNV